MRLLVALLAFACCSATNASDQTLIVAGGASPASSEISIEKNVIWISSILERKYGIDPVIMFAAGNPAATADVKQLRPANEIAVNNLAIARVFGDENTALYKYKKNSVAELPGPSTSENVTRLINDSVAKLGANDNLLFIYNGHGGRDNLSPWRHHLRLWNNTELSVSDLLEATSNQHAQSRIRFVLPQCYSGPFTRLIKQSSGFNLSNAVNVTRCGFIAAPAHRESEGCTPTKEEESYIDYSTFFFAALSGESRLEEPLLANPDLNGDGYTDLREAHYYVVLNAYSKDVPRTTSEYFLEKNEPWYSRWQSFAGAKAKKSNEFYSMAVKVASTLKYDTTDSDALFRSMKDNRERLEEEISRLKLQAKAMSKSRSEYKSELLNRTLEQFPDARLPGEGSTLQWETGSTNEVGEWISMQSTYKEMIDLATRLDEIDAKILELDRHLGMHMRGLRLFKMSRLHHNLYEHGPAEDIATYEAIRQCEAWVPKSKLEKHH